LAGSLSSTTQQWLSTSLMVATARTWPGDVALRPRHTSTRWLVLQLLPPTALLKPWLPPDDSCTTVQPGAVPARPVPPLPAELEEELVDA
jgi:hypothetical protein